MQEQDDQPYEMGFWTKARFVGVILLTQGPRLLRFRICWLLFGRAFHSGCPMCGGSGKMAYWPVTNRQTGDRIYMAKQPIEQLRRESGWYVHSNRSRLRHWTPPPGV